MRLPILLRSQASVNVRAFPLMGEGRLPLSGGDVERSETEGGVVGSISICRGTDVYEKSAELGYWLAESYWRQGVMTQAVRLICKEALETMDIVRIFAEPFAHNAGSRRVLEKAGFTYEGTMRDGVFKNGQVCSYCMYSLLRGEARL